MNRAIILPIYPEYANRILKGVKRFEYRTCVPQKPISHIVIYSTTPVKRIVGIAKVEEIISGSSSSVWEKTKYAAGISRAKFREYFAGRNKAFAFKLGAVWSVPEEAAATVNFSVPQAFSYLDTKQFDSLWGKAQSHIAVPPLLLFIGGVHGVGKDYFSQHYLTPSGGYCRSASSIIKEWKKEEFKSKLTSDIDGNQEALLYGIGKLREQYYFLVLTGHLVLLDKQKEFVKVASQIFARMAPSIIAILTDDPSKIQEKLLDRDKISWNLDEIKAFQDMELQTALQLSQELKIPFITHNNKVILYKMIKNFLVNNNCKEF